MSSESLIKLSDTYQLLQKDHSSYQILKIKPLTQFSEALKEFINSAELKSFLTGFHDELKTMPKHLLKKNRKAGDGESAPVKAKFYKWLFTIEWLDRRIILNSDIKEFDRYFTKYEKFLKKSKETLNQNDQSQTEKDQTELKRFQAAKKDHELTKMLWTNAVLSDNHLNFSSYSSSYNEDAFRKIILDEMKISSIDADVDLFSGDTYLLKITKYNSRIVTRSTFLATTSVYLGAQWHSLLCQDPIKIGLFNSFSATSEQEFGTNIPFVACIDMTADELKKSMVKFFEYLEYENDSKTSSTNCYCYEHPETNELQNSDLSFYYSEVQMEWVAHPVLFSLIVCMIFTIFGLLSLMIYKYWRSSKLRGYQNTLYGDNDTAVILEDMDDEICQ